MVAGSVGALRSIAAKVTGARRSKRSPPIAPQRASTAIEPPAGEGWLHEIELQGVRAIARVFSGKITLTDASGDDVSARFAVVVDALSALSLDDAIFDGVVCALRQDGLTDRAKLARALAEGRSAEVVYFVFDLLALEGYDLRKSPLRARKRALERVLAAQEAGSTVRYTKHVQGEGRDVVAHGCALGVAAIISKDADAPHTEGASERWRRVTCKRESAEKTSAKPIVAGVELSHPERLLYPALGVGKLALARYYESIAPFVLPHLIGRPLTLVRCPKGATSNARADCVYMRHSKVWGPSALRRVSIREKTKVGEYLVVESLAGVIALVQLSILEIHTWSSTVDDLERPDRLVLDLDPDVAVPWSEVIEGAFEVRDRLETMGLQSFVKTTGGKGLHVVVPLTPHADWAECFDFARAFAAACVREDRRRWIDVMPKERRKGKIFLDYLRNSRTNTSIAAYSTRARPHAPVSVPLSWDELPSLVSSDAFSIDDVVARLRTRKDDPWAAARTVRQKLTKKLLRAAGVDRGSSMR